jgi:hypothetical protein
VKSADKVVNGRCSGARSWGSPVTGKLTLRSAGPRTWVLIDPATGHQVGGIAYTHAADGQHYQPWRYVDGVRHDAGEAVPQLAMAARVVADRL